MFLGEQGRSRISFGTGLSPGLKILLSEEDKGKADHRQCHSHAFF